VRSEGLFVQRTRVRAPVRTGRDADHRSPAVSAEPCEVDAHARALDRQGAKERSRVERASFAPAMCVADAVLAVELRCREARWTWSRGRRGLRTALSPALVANNRGEHGKGGQGGYDADHIAALLGMAIP
jgi:hypothetical protein